MTANAFLQVAFYVVILTALTKPLGSYMARVFDGPPMVLDRLFGPVERLCYRLAGVDPDQGMTWRTYAVAMLLFNFAGLLVVYLLPRLPGALPPYPQALPGLTADSLL